jgi:hypothetical protein
LFIRSIKFYFKEYTICNITIIYTYSNDKFKQGYDKLINKYQEFNFVLQTDFKQHVINAVDTSFQYTTFFVDDNVFISKFAFNDNEFYFFQRNPEVICLSLRLNTHITYSYTLDKNINPIPQLTPGSNIYMWEWKKYDIDYKYPMSTDGHIFRTIDILGLLKALDYSGPNLLEGKLSQNPINKTFMISYKESKITNVPCNRVQEVSQNLFGQQYNISAEILNEYYLKGLVISLENFNNLKVYSVHNEVQFKFIKEDDINTPKFNIIKEGKISNHFTITIPVYNAGIWIKRCLLSIKNQTYKNFDVIIINDGSTDNTDKMITHFLSNNNCSNFNYIKFDKNYGAAPYSIIQAINTIKDEYSIIVNVDGDDYLSNNEVLNYLNTIYQNNNIWLTYGNFSASDGSYNALCKEVTDIKSLRGKPLVRWHFSHLRTYRYKLFKKIKNEDLLDSDGFYYKVAGDVSLMMPMVEMAGLNHCKYIPDVLYIYNNESCLNDFRKKPQLQVQKTNEIMFKKPYQELGNL